LGSAERLKKLKVLKVYSEGQKRYFCGADQVTYDLKFREADDRSHFKMALLSPEVLFNFA